MEMFYTILTGIAVIIAIFLITSTSAYIGSLVLHLENNTYKTAAKYGLFLILIGLIGTVISIVTLNYTPVIFFIVILLLIYAVLWLVAKMYEINIVEAFGTIVIFALMETAIIILIMAFVIAMSFGTGIQQNSIGDLSGLNQLNSTTQGFESFDTLPQ